VTLVLALKWLFDSEEAVLVSSDSKATTPLGIAYEVKKVHPILLGDKPLGIASGAGDSSLVKWGFEQARDVLVAYAQQEYPIKSAVFASAARELEYRFVRRFNELRGQGIEPSFQMVLCGLDLEGKASMYLYDSRGLAEPVHDNPGYAIIGSGFVTGGILLLNLLGYAPDIDLGLLSTFIVDTVSEVDSAVGPFIGESYLMRIETKEGRKEIALGPLKDTALIEYKQKTTKRKELIRKLWRLCDEVGEEEIEKAMMQLSRQPDKVEQEVTREPVQTQSAHNSLR